MAWGDCFPIAYVLGNIDGLTPNLKVIVLTLNASSSQMAGSTVSVQTSLEPELKGLKETRYS